MLGRRRAGSCGVTAGLSGALCRLKRFLKTSKGQMPLMGLKPPSDPPTMCGGRVDRMTPGGETVDSARSGLSSLGFSGNGRKEVDMGERSGVRGRLTVRTGGCRTTEEEEEEESASVRTRRFLKRYAVLFTIKALKTCGTVGGQRSDW